MKLKYGVVGAVLLLGNILSAPVAFAVTQQQNMAVSATVTNNCTLNVGPMAFGSIDPNGFNNSQANISITCSSPVPTTTSTATLDGGQNFGAVNAYNTLRAMKLNSNFLAYGLYTDAARTAHIAAGGSVNISAPTSPNQAGAATVIYGQVPTQTSATAGTYTDTVIVTLSYQPATP